MFDNLGALYQTLAKAADQVDEQDAAFRESHPDGVSVEFADGTTGHISPVPASVPSLRELLREVTDE